MRMAVQTGRAACAECTAHVARYAQPQRTAAVPHAGGGQCGRPATPAQGQRRAGARGLLSACAAVAVAAEQSMDVTKMEPLGDRVLVKPFEEQKVSEGGVLLAGGANDTMQDALLGEVLAVGAEVDVAVARGDKVVFSKYSSSDVKLPAGGEVCFVAQKSILATLR